MKNFKNGQKYAIKFDRKCKNAIGVIYKDTINLKIGGIFNISYSQTSGIERFGSRPNRFSNNKFEIFTFQTSNKNSDHDQTERGRANTNAP